MPAKTLSIAFGLAAAASTAVAIAQTTPARSPQAGASAAKPWVAPGTPGSPIDGQFFHAQVLMSVHGFSPGVIDGKEGESFKLALRSLQDAGETESKDDGADRGMTVIRNGVARQAARK